MGQRYIRSVSTAGGLSTPVNLVKQGNCTANYAAQEFTYSASALVTVYVQDNPAECKFWNGSSWVGDEFCPVGMNEFPSNHQGIQVRNLDAGADVAKVTISRYTT